MLKQTDLTRVPATVVHLHILQLDRAIPARDISLPPHPVSEMAHGDTRVAVVIKYHLLLSGHRAAGERSPASRALQPLPPHTHGAHHSQSPACSLLHLYPWKAPGRSTECHSAGHAAGELSSCSAPRAAGLPQSPSHCPPPVLTHLLFASPRHTQPVHFGHRPARGLWVLEEAAQQDGVPSASMEPGLCEHPSSQAAAPPCQAQGQQDEDG